MLIVEHLENYRKLITKKVILNIILTPRAISFIAFQLFFCEILWGTLYCALLGLELLYLFKMLGILYSINSHDSMGKGFLFIPNLQVRKSIYFPVLSCTFIAPRLGFHSFSGVATISTFSGKWYMETSIWALEVPLILDLFTRQGW